MRTTTQLAFALVAGCVGACDPAAALPDCAPGQVIGFASDGAAVCQSLGMDGALSPIPACTYDEALTVDADGVHCAPRTNATGLRDLELQVQELSNRVRQISNALDQLGSLANGSAVYVGSTMRTTRGRIFDDVGGLGIVAAASLCSQSFGQGSHLCTPYELHRSASLGLFANKQMARAWVYFPAWNYVPTLLGSDRERGLGDTCDGFLYDTAADGYRGVTASWGMLSSGSPGFSFTGGNDSACYNLFPLACCR